MGMGFQSGGNQSQTIECPKSVVGRIIGRGGETINMLQAKSGAKMQIDQSTQPCKIIMTGDKSVTAFDKYLFD
jgi:far upstream element-binding protein